MSRMTWRVNFGHVAVLWWISEFVCRLSSPLQTGHPFDHWISHSLWKSGHPFASLWWVLLFSPWLSSFAFLPFHIFSSNFALFFLHLFTFTLPTSLFWGFLLNEQLCCSLFARFRPRNFLSLCPLFLRCLPSSFFDSATSLLRRTILMLLCLSTYFSFKFKASRISFHGCSWI